MVEQTTGWQLADKSSPPDGFVVLVYVPGRVLSGPFLVAFRDRGEWVLAFDGMTRLAPTHWMMVEKP